MLYGRSPRARRTFVVSWIVGTLVVFSSQIAALMASPAIPGTRNVVLLGPVPIVFLALVVNLVLLGLLIRHNSGGGELERFDARGRSFVVATGLVGSLAAIFGVTIAVNLLLANVSRI